VINDSANATIAVGASPIMATNPRDVMDLSPAIGALLVNIGCGLSLFSHIQMAEGQPERS